MATLKPAYTKRGDTQMTFSINTNLPGGAVAKTFVRDSAGLDWELPTSIVDGNVVVQTSALETGKYKLEIQVTVGGIIATFPDSGYLQLNVVEDLGD